MNEKFDLSVFRKPTAHEVTQIGKSFEYYYCVNMKLGKYASIIFAIIGLIMISMMKELQVGDWFAGLIGVICLLIAYLRMFAGILGYLYPR